MRTVLIAATMLAGAGAAQAGQQRMVAQGPGAGRAPVAPPAGPIGVGPSMGGAAVRPASAGVHRGPSRHWGGQYQGHWIGGTRAPGGWGGYRRPYRGFGLTSYWISPSFSIDDWSDYGLYRPPVGYNWSRYYDDAVLIDGRGSVYDTVGGIDWRRDDLDEGQGGQLDAYYANSDSYCASAGAGYDYPPQGGYVRRGGYPDQPGYRPQGGYGQRGSDGVGGALVGGAVGGVAGGLIAGRRDRVGGALIGAGAGALTGYVIDRNARRRDDAPYGSPGAGYPMPGSGYGPGPGYPPPGGPGYLPPTVVQSGGGTYVDGFYYPPATVTTVTVVSAPVVTTTTEVFEDSVTYTRPKAHRVYRKRVWHRPVCRCR